MKVGSNLGMMLLGIWLILYGIDPLTESEHPSDAKDIGSIGNRGRRIAAHE